MNNNTTNISTGGGNFEMRSSAIGSNNKITEVTSFDPSIEDDIKKALITISAYVEESENGAAQLILKEFKHEMNSPEKNNGKLQQYWNALKSTLPDIAKLADACAKISSLFVL